MEIVAPGRFPLLDPAYAAGVAHIVVVPVARRRDWRHHFESSMALVDMALATLGGDPDRVAVAGQSMGGHGAYSYASRMAPGRFSAVVAACGYLDEDDATAAPDAVVGPLARTPLWVFHAEEDDATPPPGRAQDDSDAVVAAFRAAGNDRVEYTRYPRGAKPENYIAGHAAFEFAFHDAGLWPWLEAQTRGKPPVAPYAAFAVAALAWCAFVRGALKPLATPISTLSLLLSTVAFLGLQQAEGGIVDSCLSYSFVGVSRAKCVEIGAAVVAGGDAEPGWYALVVSKARAENCFALGMGLGGLYSLLFLAKGTKDVAVSVLRPRRFSRDFNQEHDERSSPTCSVGRRRPPHALRLGRERVPRERAERGSPSGRRGQRPPAVTTFENFGVGKQREIVTVMLGRSPRSPTSTRRARRSSCPSWPSWARRRPSRSPACSSRRAARPRPRRPRGLRRGGGGVAVVAAPSA